MPDYATRRVTMVDTQVRPSDVTRYPVIDAMLRVPREVYLPARLRDVAYAGENHVPAPGEVVLAPRTLALMLQHLDLGPGDLVLDVGAGLGYSSAVAARLAQQVVALVADADTAADAEAIHAAQEALNIAVVTGPLEAGAPRHGPFDAMMVQGGVEAFPDTLAAQLKDGGRVTCLFMDGALGEVRLGVRLGGRMNWRKLFNASAPVLPGFARRPVFEF